MNIKAGKVTEMAMQPGGEHPIVKSPAHDYIGLNSAERGFGAFLLAFVLCGLPLLGASIKSESFDKDPGWEARNNQIAPRKIKPVVQDFGYTNKNTHFAGGQAGEIGGTITRAFKPAFYAKTIASKTLNDKLSASGTFALTASAASSGFFFGWFNSQQPGGSRPVGSLGLQIDGEKSGGRLAIRLISGENKSCGTFITPFIPGHYRPTPIRNDGTHYSWTLNYEPGDGKTHAHFEFSIKCDAAKKEDFEGKTFSVDVPDEFKNQKTAFDRFGLMNEGKPGGPATVYFGELRLDGKMEDLSVEPGWESLGSRTNYMPDEVVGAHRYGFSASTSFAGGSAGEIGGTVWRTEDHFGWYADRTKTLTLSEKLEAEGRVMLAVGAPDSGVCIGWFNSHTPDNASAEKTNFVGVIITGPTRVGHYFLPVCTTASGNRRVPKQGPIIVPGKPYRWKLLFDPAGDGGNGAITVTLGDESIALNLKPGDLQEGAQLDRFGIVSIPPGGSLVKIYFDDLKYTANQSER